MVLKRLGKKSGNDETDNCILHNHSNTMYDEIDDCPICPIIQQYLID